MAVGTAIGTNLPGDATGALVASLSVVAAPAVAIASLLMVFSRRPALSNAGFVTLNLAVVLACVFFAWQ